MHIRYLEAHPHIPYRILIDAKRPADYWLFKEGFRPQFELPNKFEKWPAKVGDWGPVLDHRGRESLDTVAGYTCCGFTSKYHPEFWTQELYSIYKEGGDYERISTYVDNYLRTKFPEMYGMSADKLAKLFFGPLAGSLWTLTESLILMEVLRDEISFYNYCEFIWSRNVIYRTQYSIKSICRQLAIYNGIDEVIETVCFGG